jgi:LysR family transcriptional regulator, glycine cleavage system transcriptional activator
MSLAAAIDGLGVALGYAPFVEADLRAGRLVAPFDLALPCSVGPDAYVVCPARLAQSPEFSVFREWLLAAEHSSRPACIRE